MLAREASSEKRDRCGTLAGFEEESALPASGHGTEAGRTRVTRLASSASHGATAAYGQLVHNSRPFPLDAKREAKRRNAMLPNRHSIV